MIWPAPKHSSKGYGSGDRYEMLNYQDPYLRTIFGFMGITDITFVHIENEEVGGTGLATSIAQARTKIAELAAAF